MAVVEVPGSKSITARALFLAAAASGTTVLRKPLDSDDTAGFAEGLTALGYKLDRSPGRWLGSCWRSWRAHATDSFIPERTCAGQARGHCHTS